MSVWECICASWLVSQSAVTFYLTAVSLLPWVNRLFCIVIINPSTTWVFHMGTSCRTCTLLMWHTMFCAWNRQCRCAFYSPEHFLYDHLGNLSKEMTSWTRFFNWNFLVKTNTAACINVSVQSEVRGNSLCRLMSYIKENTLLWKESSGSCRVLHSPHRTPP